jgi:hypothetical protein
MLIEKGGVPGMIAAGLFIGTALIVQVVRARRA